uniref:Uncharacterized protein n=1 Tax=Oryza rufipogon TaxID=4529 RepID=A0A0E0REA0_ORYRU
MAAPTLQPGAVPLCKAVALKGSVTVTDVQAGSNTCHVWDQGHFALVLGGAGDGGVVAEAGEVSKWKLALFGAALGAGGTVLLGLVLVAVLSIPRRKSKVAEMAQRAYEEAVLGGGILCCRPIRFPRLYLLRIRIRIPFPLQTKNEIQSFDLDEQDQSPPLSQAMDAAAAAMVLLDRSVRFVDEVADVMKERGISHLDGDAAISAACAGITDWEERKAAEERAIEAESLHYRAERDAAAEAVIRRCKAGGGGGGGGGVTKMSFLSPGDLFERDGDILEGIDPDPPVVADVPGVSSLVFRLSSARTPADFERATYVAGADHNVVVVGAGHGHRRRRLDIIVTVERRSMCSGGDGVIRFVSIDDGEHPNDLTLTTWSLTMAPELKQWKQETLFSPGS